MSVDTKDGIIAILKVLSHGGIVTIDGFNWQADNTSFRNCRHRPSPAGFFAGGTTRPFLASNAMALRLFQRIDNAVRQNECQDRVFLFDDFERWCFKTLCGAVFSRNAQTRAVRIDWRPSRLWLDVLFDGAPSPNRWGFYLQGDSADTIEGGFKLRTFSNPNDGVYGARISFDNQLFLFLMDAPQKA